LIFAERETIGLASGRCRRTRLLGWPLGRGARNESRDQDSHRSLIHGSPQVIWSQAYITR